MKVLLCHKDEEIEIELPDKWPTPRVIHWYNGRVYLNTIDIHRYSTVPWAQPGESCHEIVLHNRNGDIVDD